MRVALIIILFVLVVSGSSRITQAQSPTDREAVLKVVQAFFDTMTAKDIAGAREILVAQGRFHAMRAGAEPRSLSNEEYLAQLQASKQTMRERIWNPEVRVHGSIATMWAPYDFWIDGKFSHCGIDAFDLIKTENGWKIAGGVYTLETKCAPGPLGPLKQ
ncbi:MAG TPA: nuclear transport factor 2 family protein [Vicinamibacterales bacterium]